MKQITNVNMEGDKAGGTVEVTYADGESETLTCSRPVALVIANLATTLKQERAARVATGDRAYRQSTRDSDMISRGSNGASSTSTAPTAMDAEFMRLVRAVAPKYDNALPDTDPRLVALDVLRYAPAEAFSAVHPKPLSEIQLDQAIDVLEQVGDYMKVNNVSPKVATGDAIRQINTDSAKFWGKTR
ncbi:XRE family transcriptional regulator [Serratia liquefaciens]|uniref:XRE family transcriptional regulator n=1 Tax=Serratia liquefaciens TaxID=614 RepID=UPI00390605CB